MIHWLLQPAAECPEIAHGEAPEWLLSPAEQERLAQLATAKRRGEWLLGRCAAKRLAQRYVAMEIGQPPPLDALVIARDSEESAAPVVIFDSQATPMDLPEGSRWVSDAPLVAVPGRRLGYPVPRVSGMRLPISLSISHSSQMALCALHAAGGRWKMPDRRVSAISPGFPPGGLVQVGVDIEQVAPRSDSFVAAYFAADEMRWVGQALGDEQALMATVTWSAKEAVLKALQIGLTVDTRRVICLPASGMELNAEVEPGWSEVHVLLDSDLLSDALSRAGRLPPADELDWQMSGWWRRAGRFVLTLAALHVTGGPYFGC